MWDAFANQGSEGRYKHIGSRFWVGLHGSSPIHAVRVEACADGDYWGWRNCDAPGDSLPTMIQANKMALGMCFTYGVQSAIDCGQGVIVRMRISPR